MNAIVADRMKRVLARLDERTAQLAELHRACSVRVARNHGETAPEALVAYRACQQCVIVETMLDGVRTLLFKSTKLPDRSVMVALRAKERPVIDQQPLEVPYDGPQDVDGKANTEYKLMWLSERFGEVGPSLGQSCNAVTIAVIDAAETYLQMVADAYEVALRVSRER
ncbi:MAG: hypothetical protein K2W95_28730 [Candidatus Obscuribacterales bacterium]|nr:hypothetical protein [Candidatus Obscuribacterales bacterium]